MNPSLQKLAGTLLFAETDNSTESGGDPLDKNYSVSDFDKESLDELHKRFQAFVERAEERLRKSHGDDWSSIDDFYIGSGPSDYVTEYDYITTVNEHGCGFWEVWDWHPGVGEILNEEAKRDSQIHVDIDDNGKLHLIFC